MLTCSSLSEKYITAIPDKKKFQLILQYYVTSNAFGHSKNSFFSLSFDYKDFKRYVVTNLGHPWGIPIFDLAWSIYIKQSRRMYVCVSVVLSGYGCPNCHTDRHQTRSADTKHLKLETDPATLYIWGHFEAEIEVQSSLYHITQTIDSHAIGIGQALGNSCAVPFLSVGISDKRRRGKKVSRGGHWARKARKARQANTRLDP